MSGDALVLYHWPQSRSATAHWMLEEAGVPYKLRIFNLAKGEHKCAELLALNPLGKLPTLVHNGAVVTETAAICAYLADSFPRTVLRRRLAIRCAGLICAGWCLPSRRWKRR